MRSIWPLLLALSVLTACRRDRAPKLEDACVAQRDCGMTQQGADCCFGCTMAPATAASVSERTAWCEKKFPGGAPSGCPMVKCLAESVTPYCLEDRCVLRSL